MDNQAVLRPLTRKSLVELYGALRATRPYPGLKAIRRAVHEARARKLGRKTPSR